MKGQLLVIHWSIVEQMLQRSRQERDKTGKTMYYSYMNKFKPFANESSNIYCQLTPTPVVIPSCNQQRCGDVIFVSWWQIIVYCWWQIVVYCWWITMHSVLFLLHIYNINHYVFNAATILLGNIDPPLDTETLTLSLYYYYLKYEQAVNTINIFTNLMQQ